MVPRFDSAAAIDMKELFSIMTSWASMRMTAWREQCRWGSTALLNGQRSASVIVHKGLALSSVLFLFAGCISAEVIAIQSPMTPPEWAYAERVLLKESAKAAAEFARKY